MLSEEQVVYIFAAHNAVGDVFSVEYHFRAVLDSYLAVLENRSVSFSEDLFVQYLVSRKVDDTDDTMLFWQERLADVGSLDVPMPVERL